MNGFFQDSNGDKSSTRLVFIGGFVVSSLVILWMALHDNMGEAVLGVYLGYCVGGYGIGKWRDSKDNIAEINMEKPESTVISENTEVKTESGNINVTTKKKVKK